MTRTSGPSMYGALVDGEYAIPAVDAAYLAHPNRRATVTYDGPEAPGTIVVDPFTKFLYLVEEGGRPPAIPSPSDAKGADSAAGRRCSAWRSGPAGHRPPT